MDPQVAKNYLGQLEVMSSNIQMMLQQQMERSRVRFFFYIECESDTYIRNHGTRNIHFEILLAEWAAPCDQPFSSVEEPEFRAVSCVIPWTRIRALFSVIRSPPLEIPLSRWPSKYIAYCLPFLCITVLNVQTSVLETSPETWGKKERWRKQRQVTARAAPFGRAPKAAHSQAYRAQPGHETTFDTENVRASSNGAWTGVRAPKRRRTWTLVALQAEGCELIESNGR